MIKAARHMTGSVVLRYVRLPGSASVHENTSLRECCGTTLLSPTALVSILLHPCNKIFSFETFEKQKFSLSPNSKSSQAQ